MITTTMTIINPDQQIIQRMGFEAWADNLIVDAIETMSGNVESDSHVIRVEKYPGETNYVVKAYVQGHGWMVHNRVVKERAATAR